MAKTKKTQVDFELRLETTNTVSRYKAVLINKTDTKFRIVDVMRGAAWDFDEQTYYADEIHWMLAPVLPQIEIEIGNLSQDDLESKVFYFIDVYDGDRSVEPKRYLALLRGFRASERMERTHFSLTIPFLERDSSFTIHDKVKAQPDDKPQVRKMTSRRLDKAITIAARAHDGHVRKGSDVPYIVHPFRTMHIASQVTRDEDILIACLLHDILEDVPEKYTKEQMMEDFGARVVGFVEDVTKDSSIKDWRERSEAYLANMRVADGGSLIVCVSDKINNLNAILIDYETQGSEVWKKFNASRDEQLWWYESIYRIVLDRIRDTPLREAMSRQMKELRKIIKKEDAK